MRVLAVIIWGEEIVQHWYELWGTFLPFIQEWIQSLIH